MRLKAFFALAVVVAMLLGGFASMSVGAQITITETRLTTYIEDEYNPAVSGDVIVWEDFRNANWDIYMYDLSTKTETQITTNTAAQMWPDVCGNIIVWLDNRNGNSDIYMYDLSTKTETQVTTNTANQWFPAVWGDIIVWEDFRNGNSDIYMYDWLAKSETRITTNTEDQHSPDVCGNIIVWTDWRNGNYDIYMYNLSTKTETQITTNTANQYCPVIDASIIVWQDGRNGNSDIYMYDLSTKTETQITTNTANQMWPDVYGIFIIVWTDNRNGNYDIYMYDLSTKTETRITTNTADQQNPHVDNSIIVWEDGRNGNLDIYMAEFSSGPAPLITVVSPNGGESWAKGTMHLITWTWTGSVGSSVKIEWMKGGVVKATVTTANDGSYTWTIGTSDFGSDWKIRITSTSNSACTDVSDNYFTITAGIACSITVVSPNGGESWKRGTQHAITWTSTSAGANVYIQLLKSGVVKGTITTANDGYYLWTIGLSNLGTDYKIRITSTSNSACTDVSDNYFTITSGAVCSIHVASPNGGEVWRHGTAHPITWTSSGAGSSVYIQLLKGTVVKGTITTANDGYYLWTIGLSNLGTDYKIRITSTSNSACTDVSDNYFTVAT